MLGRVIFIISLLLTAICGCGEDHGVSPSAFDYEGLPAPDSLDITPGNWQLTLSWKYPAEKADLVESYLVYRYYLTEYGKYLELADTTSSMGYTDEGLVGNVEYCYVVSAVDTNGIEGFRSEIECDFTMTPE